MNRAPSKRAFVALATAALVVATGAALFGGVPASADSDPTLQRLTDQLANCKADQAVARTTTEKNYAATCVTLAQRALNAYLGSLPSPSPSGSPTPSPSGPPSPTPTPSATPTTTPTPSPTTPSPTPTPLPTTPNPGSWPDATTTGVPAGTVLTSHGDVTVTVAGTVIDGWDMGSLDIRAANVTVRNSRVRCDADACLHSYSSGLRVSRVDIGPDSGYSAGIAVMDGTDATTPAASLVTRDVYSGLNIHNTSDGVRCDGGFTLTDSWVHNLAMGTGAHSDGCQTTNTGNMVFRHNVIEGGNTSAFLIQSNPTNVLIDHNLLQCVTRAGEQTSYIINVGASVPQGGVVFSNNTLAGSCQAGWDGSSANYQWTTALWFGNAANGQPVGVP